MAKVTSAKRAANRANAQKSRDPCTAAGKSVSRLNGLRHGLRAELVVVPQLENASDWEAHRAGIIDSLAPANYLEERLADRAALATWRLQRAARYERGILTQAQMDAEKSAGDSLYLYDGGQRITNLEAASRCLQHYRAAIATLERLPKASPNEEVESADAFDLIKETAARAAGIPLVTFQDDDGEEYEDLPEDVYHCDYPTFGELRGMFDAIALRAADVEDVPARTLREFRSRLYDAEQHEAVLANAIAKEREKNALPITFAGHDGRRHDELLARYETAADRALQRALAGLRLLRNDLGSVGKSSEP